MSSSNSTILPTFGKPSSFNLVCDLVSVAKCISNTILQCQKELFEQPVRFHDS